MTSDHDKSDLVNVLHPLVPSPPRAKGHRKMSSQLDEYLADASGADVHLSATNTPRDALIEAASVKEREGLSSVSAPVLEVIQP